MASIRRIDGKEGISYKITVSMGRDARDRQIRKYKTWKPDKPMTEKQMEKAVQKVAFEFERELSLGFQADNRQTFAEYAEYVYSLREQKGDAKQTLYGVKRYTERANEHIGHMKLTDIRPQHLTKLYQILAEPGANRLPERAALVRPLQIREQRKFARDTGINRRIISNLCTGNRITVSAETARRIEQEVGHGYFEYLDNNTGLSPGTIRRVHSAISTVFAQAEREMIVTYNPAKRAILPKYNHKEVRSLQPEQVQTVISALEREPIRTRTIITLFLVTGCRRGEIVALKWSNVDMNAGQIKIDSSMAYISGQLYDGQTKTKNIRYITLTEETVQLLRKYRLWQIEQRLMLGDQWEPSDYVFTKQFGGALNPNLINSLIARFCKRHGIEHINPHQFRHTAASIMIASGVDVLTVSQMLGHNSPTMTLNVYGHAIDQAKAKAAECVADVILRCENKRNVL